jgi:Glyoxalase-like domain
MSDSIRLCSTALECPDAKVLAAFYAEITGGWVTYYDDSWAVAASSMQMHLDFDIDDLDSAEPRVLAAGATRLRSEPGEHFRVFTDPVGHPFCLTTWDFPDQA